MSLWGNRDLFSITGTSVSVVNGSPTVTSNGATPTVFTTDFKEGGTIVITDVKYKILKIVSDTVITLVANYAGTTATVLNTNLKGADIPKYILQDDLQYIFFVSEEEALIKSNHDRGINGSGWWKIKEYTDSDGNPRHKTELLVAMDVLNAVSGDGNDDLTVADVSAIISISVQPVDRSIASGANTTFPVTASVTGGGAVTYQWQKAVAGSNKFTNLTNTGIYSTVTTATLNITAAVAGNNGDRYRVLLGSTVQGAPAVTSTPGVLTIT
jgi:hypothetical protein